MLSSVSTSSPSVPVSLFADPAFRRDLAADPVKALAAHGIKVAASDLPAEIRLPEYDEMGRLSADPGNGNGPDNSNGNGPPVSPHDQRGIPWFLFVG